MHIAAVDSLENLFAIAPSKVAKDEETIIALNFLIDGNQKMIVMFLD